MRTLSSTAPSPEDWLVVEPALPLEGWSLVEPARPPEGWPPVEPAPAGTPLPPPSEMDHLFSVAAFHRVSPSRSSLSQMMISSFPPSLPPVKVQPQMSSRPESASSPKVYMQPVKAPSPSPSLVPAEYNSPAPSIDHTYQAPLHPPELSETASVPPSTPRNESSKPTRPSSPPSNSNRTPTTSNMALTIGISVVVAVALTFFILAVVILCLCYRNKKRNGCLEDCKSPPRRDNFYAALPQYFNQKLPAKGAHLIPAPAIRFSRFSRIGSVGNSSLVYSENEVLPQAHVAALVFPGGNFTYKELTVATNGFSPANLLGEGGFGYVHRGVLPTGKEIAVKQLKIGSQQGEREFLAEVETISRVHHKHLVSLVGYCMTGIKRLLVYEFVPNGALKFHLHGKNQPVMEWATRMKTAIGSAKGLAYLHEDCSPTIIHRDIKAANILLDSKFEAKVSDFGLAKFLSDTSNLISPVSTRVVGTFGYLAPEYALNGQVSDKSDVYSYGVMLLELITGHHPIINRETSLVSWTRPLLRQALENGSFAALVDPHLEGNYKKEELSNMVACAAACVHQSSLRRPRMSQIVRALQGDASSLAELHEGIRLGESSGYGVFDYCPGDGMRRIFDNTSSNFELHPSESIDGRVSLER